VAGLIIQHFEMWRMCPLLARHHGRAYNATMQRFSLDPGLLAFRLNQCTRIGRPT